MSQKIFNFDSVAGKGGWYERQAHMGVKDIPNSDRTASTRPNVAVPSPFARIQLHIDAFVNCSNDNPNPSDQVLVSNILDVLQYIFEKGDQLEVLTSSIDDITDDLNYRTGSLSTYADALKSYARRETYGFNNTDQELYFFVPKGTDHVLAMTSPATIVLPTPNYEDEWTKKLTIDGEIPLFSKPRSLAERDEEFQKYIHSLRNKLKELPEGTLQAFANYVDHQPLPNNLTEDKIKKEISYDDSYDVMNRDAEPSVLGVTLRKQRPEDLTSFILNESELLLKPTKQVAHPPLVLTTNHTKKSVYSSKTVKWDAANPGFTYDDENLKNTPIESRDLPNGTKYEGGFVYEHDFLADFIVKLNYDLNEKAFFVGNVSGHQEDKEGFIPPITETFFKYFSISDLVENDMMDIVVKKGSITVTLTLPSKQGAVKFSKVYSTNELPTNIYNTSDEKCAKGCIVEAQVALNLFPNVRFSLGEQNHYIVQLLRNSNDKFSKEVSISLHLNKEDGSTVEWDVDGVPVRKNEDFNTAINYALYNKTFDYIKFELKSHKFTGNKPYFLLIPEFTTPTSNGSEFTFGFDFGTSNTFVSVLKKANNNTEFVDFKLPVSYLSSTITSGKYTGLILPIFKEITESSFFPLNGNFVPFPVATTLAIANAAGGRDIEKPFVSALIPFAFGNGEFSRNDYDIVRNLKWFDLDNASAAKPTECFIYELMFLARLFAAQNGALASDCNITWTYPTSMSRNRYVVFNEIWEKAFKKYFGGEAERVNSFTESMSPMVYYASKTQVDNAAISVDIGGGTCDIVITPDADGKEAILSSIGFGADCIFAIDSKISDVESPAQNIKMFSEAIKYFTEKLPKGVVGDSIKKSLNLHKREMGEVSQVLFSIQSRIEKDADKFSFNSWLSENHYSYIFEYYYSALIYFMAQLVKHLNINYHPDRFFFSGSGSKMLPIIQSSHALFQEKTTDLFKTFLGDYKFGTSATTDIKIKREEEMPKKITALGAITEAGDSKKVREEVNVTPKASQELRNKHLSAFAMLPSIDNKGQNLTLGRLKDKDLCAEIVKEVIKFHESLKKAFSKEESPAQITILNKLEKFTPDLLEKFTRGSINAMKGKDDDQYNDVPFFITIKRIIADLVVNSDK